MHITPTQVYRTLSILLTAILLGAMGLFTFLLFMRMNDISKEEGTYNRYTSCVLSVPALDRDAKKIESCWEKVVKDTGFEVKRYDR